MIASDFPQVVSVDISFAPPAQRNCPHSQPIHAALCVVNSFNPIHNDHQTPGRRHLGKQTGRKWLGQEWNEHIYLENKGIFANWDDVWLGGWFAWKPGITKNIEMRFLVGGDGYSPSEPFFLH